MLYIVVKLFNIQSIKDFRLANITLQYFLNLLKLHFILIFIALPLGGRHLTFALLLYLAHFYFRVEFIQFIQSFSYCLRANYLHSIIVPEFEL